MASALALRKLLTSNVVPRSSRALLRPAAASRLFNVDAVRQFDDDDDDDRIVNDDRRFDRTLSRRRDDFLSEVFNPFSPTRSLSQLLNLMDQATYDPLLTVSRGGVGSRRGWDARETEKDLVLRIDMPGLGKEDVKVTVDQNTLVIKGEGAKEEGSDESAEEDGRRRYTSRIDLPEKVYRMDQIKAEMKNGVLKVMVPKLKEEERANVRQIVVD